MHPTADTEIRVWQAEEIVEAAGADDVTYTPIASAVLYAAVYGVAAIAAGFSMRVRARLGIGGTLVPLLEGTGARLRPRLSRHGPGNDRVIATDSGTTEV